MANRFQAEPEFDRFEAVHLLKQIGTALPKEKRWSNSLIRHIELLVSLTRTQDWIDGSEVMDSQLSGQQNLASACEGKAEALETMRDCFAALLEGQFGTVWHPPRGNHVSRHRPLTQAVVSARSFLNAQEKQKRDALLPAGAKIGFAGGKDLQLAS